MKKQNNLIWIIGIIIIVMLFLNSSNIKIGSFHALTEKQECESKIHNFFYSFQQENIQKNGKGKSILPYNPVNFEVTKYDDEYCCYRNLDTGGEGCIRK